MSFWKSTFLHTLLCLSFCQLFSQKYLFDAQLLTSEDGLANSSTSSVYKDKNGYLWIGTNRGLNRYDGYNFSLYTQAENGLYSNKPIHQIKEDATGNLWLYYFSNKGHLPTSLDKVEAIDIFNPQTGKATPFDLFFKDKVPFTLEELNNTRIIDDKNRIWLTTKRGELYLFQNGQFLKVYEQKNAFIQYVTVDNKDNIWLGYDKTITKINLDGVVQETQHLSDDVLGIWTDNNEQLWWVTGDWVAEYGNNKPIDKSKKINTRIWSKEKQGTVFQLILNKGVEAITFDFIGTFFLHRSKAGYWYAQIENQLNIFDRDGQFIYNYHNYHDLVEKDLRIGYGNYFEADNNELWLSTPLGLIKTKVNINPFKLIQGKKGHTDYRGIAEAENGTIFFQCAGLYQFNPKNPELPEKNKLQGYHALIYEDSIVWSGTYAHNYLGTQLDLRTKEIYSYKGNTSKALLSFAALKRTLPFDYLIGTNEGVHYLNIQQKKNRPFTQYNGFDTLKHSQVYHFHKNAKGIWLATNNGVFLMDEKEGIIRKYNTTSKDLPVNFIRHIYEAKEGVFWLATKGGGIIKWKPAQTNEQVSDYQQFTTKNGLSHNATYAIYGDDYGKLWIPSDKGF